MLKSGDTIGSYEILRRLRRGGMATLYLARRRGAAGFAKHVAIKVVNEAIADDQAFVTMFIDEAKLTAQIQHPNVVHIEDFGERGGAYFMAMEYVHGCSLAQLLKALRKNGRRLSPELAVYIALKTAEGLHAAHQAKDAAGKPLNVIHRDVNPANILLAFDGHVKLIDFGVARSDERSHETTSGSLKGKFRYMAPEMVRGLPFDHRVDIWSLGVSLWESLTGQRLFDAGSDVAVLEKIRTPDVKAPGTVVSEVPAALDDVVLRALAADVQARIASARELRTRLVGAMPSAAILDSSALSELLRAVLQDQLMRKQAKLPDSLTGNPAADSLADDEADAAIDAMTISNTGTNVSVVERSNSTVGTEVSASLSQVSLPPRNRRPLWMALGIGAIVALGVSISAAMGTGAGAPTVEPPATSQNSPATPVVEQPVEPLTEPDASSVSEVIEAPIAPDAGVAIAVQADDPAPTAMRRDPRTPHPVSMARPTMMQTSPAMQPPTITQPTMMQGAPTLVDDVF